ncbi:hypothetical protein [Gordonia hongkongensis]|uniref:hypothetical protein n=1 Tax=Gordonia hongkongensis TaxID=1701090 RepID=UPI003AF0B5EA
MSRGWPTCSALDPRSFIATISSITTSRGISGATRPAIELSESPERTWTTSALTADGVSESE